MGKSVIVTVSLEDGAVHVETNDGTVLSNTNAPDASPALPAWIDPATGVNYEKFVNDENLTDQEALKKLIAEGVVGDTTGMNSKFVGANPGPYFGWSWDFYHTP